MTISKTARISCLLAGVILIAGAGALAWHGGRASVAFQRYYAAKYGSSKGDVTAVLELCDEASSRYRWNYHACILACETAYDAAGTATNAQRNAWLREREHEWCERGLALNRYISKLRLLKAWALARKSPIEGARYWEEYVDWDYWDTYNHRVLVELYSRAGELEKAEDCLKAIDGHAQSREAEAALRTAWERQEAELERRQREGTTD